MRRGLLCRLWTGERILVAPTLAYHFYPAFAEYPGSTSLRLETARDLTVDVVRSLPGDSVR